MIISIPPSVKAPDGTTDLVASGLLSDIQVDGDKVIFSIRVDPARAAELEPMRQSAEQAVRDKTRAKTVLVAMTAEQPAGARAAPTPGGVACATMVSRSECDSAILPPVSQAGRFSGPAACTFFRSLPIRICWGMDARFIVA